MRFVGAATIQAMDLELMSGYLAVLIVVLVVIFRNEVINLVVSWMIDDAEKRRN